MAWFRGMLERVRETFARRRADDELEEEIRYHLERETERLIARGMDPEAAAAEARREFGRVRRVREEAREERGFHWLEQSMRDVRHAARALRKSPSFTFAAVVTLALGVGAATAIFTVLNGVVLRPLPYGDSGRIVSISHTNNEGAHLGMPNGGYFYYRDHASSLSDLAVYLEVSEAVEGTGEPLELAMIYATPSIFDVLRVAPLHGRLFTEADAQPGAPDVAVLTYGFWRSHFAGDPDVLGQPLLPGSDVEIIGVLPPDFEMVRADASVVFGNAFAQPDILAPLGMREAGARFGNFMYQGIGRLADGANAESAERELMPLIPQAAETYPGGHTIASLREGAYRPVVRTLKDAIVGRLASTLWILLGAVGLLLLIAIANVANLFLARAESRRREIAVRRSLGAGIAALARASIAEGLVLAAVGGVLGAALAVIGVRILLGLAPPDLPRLDDVSIDGWVLGFTGGLTLLTGLVFGLFPLAGHARVDARAALGEESRGSTIGVARQRTRRLLVSVQVAFALVLLVGAGLLVRTFENLRRIDPGFEGDHVLSFRVSLGGLYDGDVGRSTFLVDLTRRLEEVPGVEMATFSGDLPLDGDEWRDDIDVEGAIAPSQAERTSALRVFIGPGYLEAIGATLVRGRELERRDFDGYPQYVVVNESFAEQRWPGEDPIGRRLMQAGSPLDGDVWYTVSGVVRDIRETSLMTPPEPTVYLPTVFKPDDDYAMFVQNMPVVIRTEGDPASAFRAIESELHAYAPEVPVNNVMTLDRLVARSFQQVSFAVALVTIASVVALVLGFVGIYGVVAYLVSLRAREFGVRVALGATPRDVLAQVVGEGGRIALAGIAAGLVVALFLSRILRSLLFGVGATDAVTYAVVSVGLLLVVLFASVGPARRAMAADPVKTIRMD